MRRNRRPRKAAGLLGALLLLAVGCGDDDSAADDAAAQVEEGDDDDGGDGGGNDNCALVTAEEASALIGEPVQQPPDDSALGCGWTPEGETLAHLIVNTLDDPRSPLEIMVDDWQGADVDIDDLADGAAYNVSSDDTVTAFAVRNGGRTVLLVTTFIGIEETTPEFDTLVATARSAAERL